MTIFLNWIYKNVLANRPTACKARSGWAPPEGIPSLNETSEVITYSECLIQIKDASFLEFGFIKMTPMPIGLINSGNTCYVNSSLQVSNDFNIIILYNPLLIKLLFVTNPLSVIFLFFFYFKYHKKFLYISVLVVLTVSADLIKHSSS
jgi:hypothetical protein